MSKNQITMPTEEQLVHHHHHLICWRSILAGLFVAFVSFLLLSSLGAGVAGFTAEGLINKEEGGSALATGAGLWLGLSIIASLFCGGYFAVRISHFMTSRIGAAQGLVIASVFFVALVFGAGQLIGGVAGGLGKVAQAAGDGASSLSNNPAIQDTVNKALANTNLKSDPAEVLQGLTLRLLQGDTESAKNYYAYQSGLAPAEVDAKLSQMRSDFDVAVKRVSEKTAHAVGDTGLMLFVVVLLGLISAAVGGRTGAHANVQHPFAKPVKSEVSSIPAFGGLQTQRGSVVPYIFGWLLGVPVSILFLIALLRSVF